MQKEESLENEGRREILRRRLLTETKAMTDKDIDAERAMRGNAISEKEQEKFRSVGALLNFVGPDRVDVLYPLKEILRAVSSPGEHDVTRMKRLLRYMKGLPRLATTMPWGGEIGNVVVYVDSDFAACRVTRKSTSGGAIV